MECTKCGKEFEGQFCPECGTQAEETLSTCPVCGKERVEGSKFCPNCGYNFDTNTEREKEVMVNTDEVIFDRDVDYTEGYGGYAQSKKSSRIANIFIKIYRWLIAGGMLFVGIVSLLCLTAPTIVESAFGFDNKLCTGFMAIGGKDIDVPSSVVGASRMLLIISLLCLAYGGVQLFFAFKKPYKTVKKLPYWIIDGSICFILFVLGLVVAGATNSDNLINAKIGSGFAMCIVMGVFGLVFLAARIVYELKFFKWEDTGLSEEQIAKAQEKKERKKRIAKQDSAQEEQRAQTPVANVVNKSSKKRKHALWVLDGLIAIIPIICLILLIRFLDMYNYRGHVVAAYLGKLVSVGLLLGLIALICIFIRLIFEFRVYKWVDPEPNKKLTVKQKIIIPLALAIVLVAIIVPSVVVSNNIFRTGKVDQIYIGDSKDFVVKTLGEPYEKSPFRYEYYSDNYIKLAEQIKKEYGFSSCAVNLAKDDWDFDWDDDIDFDEDMDWDDDFDKAAELENKMLNLTYKYIQIDFDSDWNVSSVFFDADKCNRKEKKKIVKKYEVSGETTVKQFETLKLTYTVKYDDGSLFKGSAIDQFCSDANQKSVEWKDSYGNTFTAKILVTPTNRLTSSYISLLTGGNESELTEFVIPDNITKIEYRAFENCVSLTSIVIPSKVTYIGSEAFYHCSSLTIYCEATSQPSDWSDYWNELYHNDYCPVVWDYKEHGTTSGGIKWVLTNSNTLMIVGYSGISNQLKIPSTINGNNVVAINRYAFSDCSALTSVEIPDSVTSIGLGAFSGCNSLKSITIPFVEASLNESEDTYFGYIFGARSYDYNNSYVPTSLDSVIISGGTRIDSYAFYNCSSLISIVIPSGVTSIGSYAFRYCNPLTIYCEASSKPSGWSSNWNYSNCQVEWGYSG